MATSTKRLYHEQTFQCYYIFQIKSLLVLFLYFPGQTWIKRENFCTLCLVCYIFLITKPQKRNIAMIQLTQKAFQVILLSCYRMKQVLRHFLPISAVQNCNLNFAHQMSHCITFCSKMDEYLIVKVISSHRNT